ncbi:hypothetical protein B0T22DRAFT_466004 [Podospora appendiculata]|uniref:Uncharacterized protein n=1 Tax=Podospora appendiculata TaxID=314037 RepID=A0AAE0X5Y7_9PEZI|nr:hypothetical protein B0T22DRAFT_466004 [Podospora appendiculata]
MHLIRRLQLLAVVGYLHTHGSTRHGNTAGSSSYQGLDFENHKPASSAGSATTQLQQCQVVLLAASALARFGLCLPEVAAAAGRAEVAAARPGPPANF